MHPLTKTLQESHGPVTMLQVLAEYLKTGPGEKELEAVSKILSEKSRSQDFEKFRRFENEEFSKQYPEIC